MNTKAWWNQILVERKAETLKSLKEKDQLDQEGQTFFQKFNNFMMLCLLVAVPIVTMTALVTTAKGCSPYKGTVTNEQKINKKGK